MRGPVLILQLGMVWVATISTAQVAADVASLSDSRTNQRSLVEPEESSRRRPTYRPTYRPPKKTKSVPVVVADPVYDPEPGVNPGNTPGVDPGKIPGEDPGFTPGYVDPVPENSDAPATEARPADAPAPPADTPVAPEVPPVSTPDVPAVVPAVDAEPSSEPTTAVESESKPASSGDVVLAGLAFLAISAIAFYFLFERRKVGYTRLSDNSSHGKNAKKAPDNGVVKTDNPVRIEAPSLMSV